MNIERTADYATPRDTEPDDFDPEALAEWTDEDWLDFAANLTDEDTWLCTPEANECGVLPPDLDPWVLAGGE